MSLSSPTTTQPLRPQPSVHNNDLTTCTETGGVQDCRQETHTTSDKTGSIENNGCTNDDNLYANKCQTQRNPLISKPRDNWLTKLRSNIPEHKDVHVHTKTKRQSMTKTTKTKLSMGMMRWLQGADDEMDKGKSNNEFGTGDIMFPPKDRSEKESSPENGQRSADKCKLNASQGT